MLNCIGRWFSISCDFDIRKDASENIHSKLLNRAFRRILLLVHMGLLKGCKIIPLQNRLCSDTLNNNGAICIYTCCGTHSETF